MGPETIVGSQDHLLQPKLSLVATNFNMDMWRFLALTTEKVKAVTPNT